MSSDKFVIDLRKQFPNLNKAPIAEAAVQVRVTPASNWNPIELKVILSKVLPEYPKVEDLRQMRYEIKAGGAEESNKAENLGCVGLRMFSADGKYICQFNFDSFLLSRLPPYKDWPQFTDEILKLLKLYFELLKPQKTLRIGLRFINRMIFNPEKEKVEIFLNDASQSLKPWGLVPEKFFYQNLYKIPGMEYNVSLTKAIQGVDATKEELIFDIDVFRPLDLACNTDNIRKYLDEMRYIKNEVFFANILNPVERFK